MRKIKITEKNYRYILILMQSEMAQHKYWMFASNGIEPKSFHIDFNYKRNHKTKKLKRIPVISLERITITAADLLHNNETIKEGAPIIDLMAGVVTTENFRIRIREGDSIRLLPFGGFKIYLKNVGKMTLIRSKKRKFISDLSKNEQQYLEDTENMRMLFSLYDAIATEYPDIENMPYGSQSKNLTADDIFRDKE